MLEGNETFKKTVLDEQIEIHQKNLSQDNYQREAYESCKILKTNKRGGKVDKIF